MKKNISMRTGSIKWLLASAALVTATPSYSEYYIGLDATYMHTKTVYADGSTKFELAPARIKFGRRYEEFGWEIQALTPTDDTGEFTGITGGIIDEYRLRGGLGILFTISTPGRGFYGGFGFTQIVSDYALLQNGQELGSTTNATPFTTINFGGQINIAKNTHLTLDYTFYHGDIDCNFCTGNTANSTDPDVRMSTFGIGISYSF